jgi:hypothetical protein
MPLCLMWNVVDGLSEHLGLSLIVDQSSFENG